MATYSEIKGKAVIDWNHVLDNWDDYSYEEQRKFKISSKNWVTCACGNQCAKIPREPSGSALVYGGAPKDTLLLQLGQDFYNHLSFHRIGAAKRTLNKIEKRSIQVLEILENLN